MMTISQLLDGKGRQIFAIAPDAAVLEALRRMAEHQVGALLVMVGDTLHGVVSERDYARNVVLKGRSSPATPVSDIMTASVVTISEEATVEEAMREMTQHRIRHLPVMQGGRVSGIVSIGDLVKCVIEDQRHLIEDLQSYIHS
ncbi:MAG: CBS domain-containing protein [Nevskiaceae bacterium]|jgi:CBS domain-containing protein|nr:CBS domain-containing protein [Nevskiaceae bacterium]